MWSLETIRHLNAEAAAHAKRHGKKPVVVTPAEIDSMPPFPFPYIGDLEPKGWERLDDDYWFVDSSGFGQEGEPALTAEQFKRALKVYVLEHPERGFAITEAGQFQVYVYAFQRV